jgi:hypothetical protein
MVGRPEVAATLTSAVWRVLVLQVRVHWGRVRRPVTRTSMPLEGMVHRGAVEPYRECSRPVLSGTSSVLTVIGR